MRNMYFLVSNTGSPKEQNLSLTPYRSWTYDFLVVPGSLIGTCLTLPNLGFLWVFFKYPKISKNESLLFFPVILLNIGKKRKKKGKSAKRKEKRRRLAEARKVCKQLLVFYIIIHLLFLQDLLKKITDVRVILNYSCR